MLNERIITLGGDGIFAASARGAACHLMFDSTTPAGRWLLSFEGDGAESTILLSIHATLDSGLKALSEQAGWANKRFAVALPDGEKFIRPGKVPAGEILAAHGYVLVPSIVAFVIYEPGASISAEGAEQAVRSRLANLPVAIGSVDPIGEPDTAWCCDVSIPFEGYLHRGDFDAVVAEFLGATGLEISDVYEGAAFTEVAPNRADVMPIFSEAA